ncbi:SDR family NAD(P)-dependent oxidoreductase [Acetobacter oeni]|uniref:Ketoacyl reductase n=1 Tax=Acetobacter oeni TaxID=304077 RepID=A0A511XJ62_9PROT|nr:SDR family oxidoreductase [Acetobacter oeni]MBB3882827.1 NAD(P)-dependent dehydrogenase (short-subunit alcohol dehydrogenase family) [Acetobacter oeni]NHO18915.1 SDR family oxidoreductase [Acetobacter oeni]GBR09651.1 dehydrogenase [Acetobacter oeni LMG 21952]GEN62987.1 ketoacyl reductase [Acetobacter oeni]
MDLGLTGRLALVTGGDSGIGFHTAQRLLREGARVALTDMNQKSLDAAVEKLGHYGDVKGFAADLTDPARVHTLHEAVRAGMGDPEIIVSAAGITGPTGFFHDLTEEDWRKVLDVNFLTALRVARAFIPAMRRKGWGRVVFIASEDAVQPYIDELPYCASKAALLSLSKGLSNTYGPDGITVNCVSPAFIETPMTDAMMEKRAKRDGVDVDTAVKTFIEKERPMMTIRRRGRAEEVADAIACLVSASASFTTGAVLRVDGGSVGTMV